MTSSYAGVIEGSLCSWPFLSLVPLYRLAIIGPSVPSETIQGGLINLKLTNTGQDPHHINELYAAVEVGG